VFVESGQLEQGLEFARSAIERHPREYELYALRAALYSLKSEPRAAESEYRKALQLSPDSEWIYSGLASILAFDLDRLEDAKSLLESRLEQFKDFFPVYLYSELARRAGLYEDPAVRERLRTAVERAVVLNPDFAPLRLNLGRIYAALGDLPKARSEMETAISRDPHDKRAYYELSRMYLRIGEQQKAKEMLARVSEINEQEQTRTVSDNVRERLQMLRRARERDGGS
jgi:Flp pilus assembly protein TadD